MRDAINQIVFGWSPYLCLTVFLLGSLLRFDREQYTWVQNHPEQAPGRAWQQAARALVVRELILQEARRQGLTAELQTDSDGRRETDEEALIRALVDREVTGAIRTCGASCSPTPSWA